MSIGIREREGVIRMATSSRKGGQVGSERAGDDRYPRFADHWSFLVAEEGTSVARMMDRQREQRGMEGTAEERGEKGTTKKLGCADGRKCANRKVRNQQQPPRKSNPKEVIGGSGKKRGRKRALIGGVQNGRTNNNNNNNNNSSTTLARNSLCAVEDQRPETAPYRCAPHGAGELDAQQHGPTTFSPIFEPLTPENGAEEDVIEIEQSQNSNNSMSNSATTLTGSSSAEKEAEMELALGKGGEGAGNGRRRTAAGEQHQEGQAVQAEEEEEGAFTLAQLEPQLRLIAWRFQLQFRNEHGAFVLSRISPTSNATDLLLFSDDPSGKHICVSEFRECRTVASGDGRRFGQWTSKSARWPKGAGKEQFVLAVRGKCDQLLYSRLPSTSYQQL